MDSAGVLGLGAPTTAISLRRRLEVDVSIMDDARRCAWPVGARRVDPAPRTGPARSWASWHFGRCRPVGVDAWLQLSQRQSQLPPQFLAAARLCFVFESHFLAIDSGRRLPAPPNVFWVVVGVCLF